MRKLASGYSWKIVSLTQTSFGSSVPFTIPFLNLDRSKETAGEVRVSLGLVGVARGAISYRVLGTTGGVKVE